MIHTIAAGMLLLAAACDKPNSEQTADSAAQSSEQSKELSARLASEAVGMLEDDPTLAFLLARRAMEASTTPEAERVLREAPPSLVDAETSLDAPATKVAFRGDQILVGQKNGGAVLWERGGGGSKSELEAHEKKVTALAIGPDGECFVTAAADGSIRTSNTSGDEVSSWMGHEISVQSVDVGPDGELLATAAGDGTVRVWTPEGETEAAIDEHDGGVASVSFEPEANRLLTAAYDGTAALWTLEGERVTTFEPDSESDEETNSEDDDSPSVRIAGGSIEFIHDADFRPNGGEILTVSSTGAARLWTREAEMVREIDFGGSLFAADFAPDGDRFAAVGTHRSHRGFIAPVEGDSRTNFGDFAADQTAELVRFSPDGRRLAVGLEDGDIQLWDSKTERRGTILGTDAAWASDSTLLAVAGDGPNVRVHYGGSTKLLEAAREADVRDLTAEERERFDIP